MPTSLDESNKISHKVKMMNLSLIVNFGLNDTFKIKDHKRHEVYVIHFLDKNYLADNQFFTRPIINQSKVTVFTGALLGWFHIEQKVTFLASW